MSNPRWQLVPGVHVRQCGDEWAVFHVGRGTTHLLTAAGGRVLRCLENRRGWPRHALMTRLELEPNQAQALSDRLETLRDSGLIRECTECDE